MLFTLDILSQACEKHIQTRFSLWQCRFWSITQAIPSVASKRGHETKKTCCNRVLDMTCFVAKHFEVWQPLKQTVTPKVSCLFVFDQRVPLKFHLSQLSVTFLAQKQHTCLQILFLTSKNLVRTDSVEQKQIKSTTAPYSKLRTFGAKTCHFCTQWEHVFSSRVHV